MVGRLPRKRIEVSCLEQILVYSNFVLAQNLLPVRKPQWSFDLFKGNAIAKTSRLQKGLYLTFFVPSSRLIIIRRQAGGSMRRNLLAQLGIILVSALLVVAVDTIAAAQGRGHGGGVGGGRGSGMGQPSGVGVDRGLGRSSDASDGRADRGRDNASVKSDGRSDAGIARARVAGENMNAANKDLQAHPGIAGSLHVNANVLRSQYQVALTQNPNLKFGQFVAATRLAHNLGRNNPNITRDAILAGLAAGKSLGRTLQDLGLSSREANEAKKQAEREFELSRK